MSNFPELGLGEKVLKAVAALGFEQPTPIQQQAIPLLLKDRTDFVGLAQTGTGKTAAFGLPLVDRVDFQSRETQALVLAPTRELCVQIAADLAKFSQFEPAARVVAVYGGANIGTQIRQLRQGAQIVVATPGRLIDLIGKRALDLETVRYTVLDEADEMLNMGFQEDITEILSHTPDDKNVWLFSATMPREVRSIAEEYMHEPVELTMGRQNEAANNLEHHYYVVHERERYAALKRLLDASPGIFGVVFCRTKIDTQQVAEQLIRDGYNADALHGDLSQQQRDKVMDRYRNRSLQVLVATDVAARGIDVRDITHVIHYHLPDESENYTHRSGRTARAGRSGLSLALVNVRELDKIRQIEKKINAKFHLSRIPDALEIGEQQLLNFIRKIHEVEVDERGVEKFTEVAMHELADLSKEQILKRIISLEFNRFIDYYRNAPDLNVDLAHHGKQRQDRYRSNGPKVFINLGTVDGFDKGRMLGYVCDVTGLKGSDIGRIELKGVYSFLEVADEMMIEAIEQGFQGEFHRGRPVRIERTGGDDKAGRKKRPYESGSGKEYKKHTPARQGTEQRGYPKKEYFGGKKAYPGKSGDSYGKTEDRSAKKDTFSIPERKYSGYGSKKSVNKKNKKQGRW
jgi:ATP-dependent RNA helicase DeaD